MKTEIYTTLKRDLISTPVPEQTKTYKPVSHGQLIDLTLEGLQKAGLTLSKETYSSASHGQVANGNYIIGNVDDDEMHLMISWRNSYNKTLPLMFLLGAMVKVCGNGMMKSQELGYFKQKHWGAIQTLTPHAIVEYLKGAGEMFMQLQKEREEMKQIELTKRVQAEIIGRMCIEEQFIQSTQLNIVKRELARPTHDYGDQNSLWSLYQYTTFAMREDHPSLRLQNHIDAHKFFTNEAGTLIPKVAPLMFPKIKSPYVQLSIFEDAQYAE